ncbi:MAG: chromosomal replication initiator protein DnaA [Oscillospiraceae bacterium]|nr:chromosomal replication initiator protein DnaA [Oscillospiraceae bacterium]
MNSFDEVFEQVKKYMAENNIITEVVMTTWINTMVPVRLDGQDAVFKVDTDFQQGIIQTHYKAKIEKALEEVMGFPVNLVLIHEPPAKEEEPAPHVPDPKELEEKHAELQKSYELSEYDYTFDTFIVGRSNEFAFAACKAVATDVAAKDTESKDTKKLQANPLFIYGPSGLGKTHLVTAIKHEITTNSPDTKVIYVTGETFGNELIKAINERDTSGFHDKYRNADVLIVDDIQFFSGKERTQEEFFHTFNKLHSEGKQIIITSDKPPRDLKTLEERIRSRFEWGLIADISTPDFETRFAIIRRKAELLDLKIPDEVVEFIAGRLKTNIRQLEGAVKKLKALKMLANSSPTISMAQSVIRDILTDDQPIPITVENIIAEVAQSYGITPDEIRSAKRTSVISNARKVAAYVVREVTGMSLAAIGIEFGGRDHSTIVYAINSVNDAIQKDEGLKTMVEEIINDIREKNPQPINN